MKPGKRRARTQHVPSDARNRPDPRLVIEDKHDVGLGATRPDPGLGFDVVLVVVGWVQDAPDQLVAVEYRVGEPGSGGEVPGVPHEVYQVPLGRHLGRPLSVGDTRRDPNVGDVGRPGLVVALVVLGSEALQPEAIGRRFERHPEVIRDEEARHETGPIS